jgi:hypothetical protein
MVPGGSFIQPFLGSALKSVGNFLPHFAEGGDVQAGQAIWTGEKGPEPFIPKTAGTIIPNHMLGGGGDTHIHVDARGSSDPAAMHAAIMRAAPHIARSCGASSTFHVEKDAARGGRLPKSRNDLGGRCSILRLQNSRRFGSHEISCLGYRVSHSTRHLPKIHWRTTGLPKPRRRRVSRRLL